MAHEHTVLDAKIDTLDGLFLFLKKLNLIPPYPMNINIESYLRQTQQIDYEGRVLDDMNLSWFINPLIIMKNKNILTQKKFESYVRMVIYPPYEAIDSQEYLPYGGEARSTIYNVGLYSGLRSSVNKRNKNRKNQCDAIHDGYRKFSNGNHSRSDVQTSRRVQIKNFLQNMEKANLLNKNTIETLLKSPNAVWTFNAVLFGINLEEADENPLSCVNLDDYASPLIQAEHDYAALMWHPQQREVQSLISSINDLFNHGIYLLTEEKAHDQAIVVLELALTLRKKVYEFFSLQTEVTPKSAQVFINDLTTLLNAKEPAINQHRNQWSAHLKKIAYGLSVALAVSGVIVSSPIVIAAGGVAFLACSFFKNETKRVVLKNKVVENLSKTKTLVLSA